MTAAKRVVVVGAGVGGLSAALALSRAGHQVVVLERDTTPVPERFGDAFAWERQGAPQFHHSHAFMPRLRSILRDRFPDVLQCLLDHGVPERPAGDALFGLPADHPGAEDLVLLPCRRTTYEWVLRRSVVASDVELRTGVTVDGVVAGAAGPGEVPAVTGVRLAGGEVIAADLVVATTGRRGDVPAWLAEISVEIPETVEEAGVSYLSRFYQVRDDVPAPEIGYVAARRGGVAYCGFEADNRTMSLTLLVEPADREMRRHLTDEARYDATCALMPEISALVDPAVSQPVTSVHVMGGLINRLRTFVDPAGQPVVAGFFAVGDAYMVTNPVYARGCTVAMIQAVALADALAEHPDDPMAQARAYEVVAQREVVPWFHLSVVLDRMTAGNDDGSDFAVGAGGGGFGRMISDPDVLVGFARVFSMLDPPEVLYRDPKLLSVFSAGFSTPPRLEGRGPRITREDILKATAAA